MLHYFLFQKIIFTLIKLLKMLKCWIVDHDQLQEFSLQVHVISDIMQN